MRGGLFGPLWCARVPPPSAFGGAQYEPCSQTCFRPSTSRPAPDGRNRIQQFHFSSESKGVIRMWPLGATHAAKYCDKRLKSPGISSRTALPHSRSTSTLRRGNALSCTGRGHYLQLSGGRDGQPRCWRGHAGDPDPFDRTLSEGCWVGPMWPHRTTEWYCYGARMKSLASMAGPLTPLRRMVPPPATVMTVFDPAVWVTLAAKVAAVIPSGRRSILS